MSWTRTAPALPGRDHNLCTLLIGYLLYETVSHQLSVKCDRFFLKTIADQYELVFLLQCVKCGVIDRLINNRLANIQQKSA